MPFPGRIDAFPRAGRLARARAARLSGNHQETDGSGNHQTAPGTQPIFLCRGSGARYSIGLEKLHDVRDGIIACYYLFLLLLLRTNTIDTFFFSSSAASFPADTMRRGQISGILRKVTAKDSKIVIVVSETSVSLVLAFFSLLRVSQQ